MNHENSLVIGENKDGGPAALDLPAFIGSHCCLIANSGGGKSGLLRRLLEVTHGRVQQIILDAEDEFYTLREKFPYVIAGGDNGDLPIRTEAAGSLALAALEHSLSMVVQLNDLPDRAAFVGAFLAGLVGAPKNLWRPVLVVIDEAQRFAPEGAAAESSAGVRDLLERGRKRGFTAVLASNRLAVIDKSVTGNVNNWLLGRVGQSRDRVAVADALGFSPGSPEARGLQSLPPRTFWSFGPAFSPVPAQFRVGDVETTIIKAGQAHVATPPAPTVVAKILRDLAKSMSAPSTPAVENGPVAASGDAELLRETLRTARVNYDDLQRQVQQMRSPLGLAINALNRAHHDNLHAIAKLEAACDWLCGPFMPPEAYADRAETTGPDPEARDENHGLSGRPDSAPRKATLEAPRPATPARTVVDARGAKLSKMARAILAVVAAHHPRPRTRTQTALQAGYSAKSGSFSNALSELRTSQYLRDGDPLVITPGGVAAAGDILPMPRGRALVEFWNREVGRMAATVLSILAEPPRTSWAKDTLAARAGYSATSGSFSNALSKLRTLGLISGSGELVAHADLFGKGARR